MIRQHFCKACGVAGGWLWPRPEEVRLQEGTGMCFYTPDFWLGVGARVNQQVFERVVALIMDQVVSIIVYGTNSGSALW
jgi:hypothetical protein